MNFIFLEDKKMENKYHIGQIVETLVDLEENGIKIDKGSIC
jgi:hypothetical protein